MKEHQLECAYCEEEFRVLNSRRIWNEKLQDYVCGECHRELNKQENGK